MRIVYQAHELADAFARASGEAKAAFGRGEVFCERYIPRAKHIEVQLLADSEGNCVHLFERDCSVQRRYQKVVEVAPSVTLGESLRNDLYNAALRIADASDYLNAGTVEFLVDDQGRYYFIEVNPRIQVEHTITEVITGLDLVQSQLRVAEGYLLRDPEIGISNQASLSYRGYAIQCRITTEDPRNNFFPDTGKIRAYRAAEGFGVRLDGGTAGIGGEVSSHYDTLLVKMTASGLTFKQAAAKSLRSLREFRVRGVTTPARK